MVCPFNISMNCIVIINDNARITVYGAMHTGILTKWFNKLSIFRILTYFVYR